VKFGLWLLCVGLGHFSSFLCYLLVANRGVWQVSPGHSSLECQRSSLIQPGGEAGYEMVLCFGSGPVGDPGCQGGEIVGGGGMLGRELVIIHLRCQGVVLLLLLTLPGCSRAWPVPCRGHLVCFSEG
jgi:hypothetical protein